MIVEVNGEQYESIERKSPKMSSKMMSILAMGMIMSGNSFGGYKEPERPQVDIVKEYELIQQKKSNLTKAQRNWVVHQFESNFKKITL
ncbi:MAG: hypothetical protein WC254_07350 [Candidatus Woesearchaeota archaeon]|jgi:hypothetical protein